MSIFSRLKMSKKAAKEHKAKTSKQIKPEDLPKVPYKHVPKHAKIDALSGAPSSWKHDDKSKILEHNKRRSMMTVSRTGSALSTMHWNDPHNSSTPSVPSLLRSSSYNSYNPTWNDRGDFSYLNEPYHRRVRVSRNHSFIDSGIGPSPLGSTSASKHVSPTPSSHSSLTDDNLEIRPSKRPRSNIYPPKDIFDRLHKSTDRKLGEAPLSSPTSSSPKIGPAATVAPPSPKMDKAQKKKWLLKGKSKAVEIGVAS